MERERERERECNREVDREDREQREQLGCQIKWECEGEKLVLPLCSDEGESRACSASNFHTSISAQLRNALWNQSSRKYP